MYANNLEIANEDNPFLQYAERYKRDSTTVEFVVFTKPDAGCLSKKIGLRNDGTVLSDGSECIMTRGTAARAIAYDVHDFAAWVGGCGSDQALALGRLREGLDCEVTVVTKHKLAANPGAIARSGDYIGYREGEKAYALIDFDLKGMPAEVKDRIESLGGFWPALVTAAPELKDVTRVVRTSTSTGLFRTDTGQRLEGSGGLHVYVLVWDGADINRFLRTLHERCWLAGLGWHMLGAGGQLLERSVVDKMVGSPERLVFEGKPICVRPIEQDQKMRQPQTFEGAVLDTVAACPPLTIVERSNLQQVIAKSAVALAPESARAREKYVAEHAVELAARVGVTVEVARNTIERRCAGVLLPDEKLPFDDGEFAGCTVGDVMADPSRFKGATLADPIEGAPYGRSKARVYLRSDGTPWIRSFAHGLTTYELKFDARAVAAAIEGADPDGGTAKLAKLVADSDLGDDEKQKAIVAMAEKFPAIGKRVISKQIKDAKERKRTQEIKEKVNQQLASRTDPRPRIIAPDGSAPWLPVMAELNEVIGGSKAKHPQARDVNGYLAAARRSSIPGMHPFSSDSANAEQPAAATAEDTSLPAPEQWTLNRLTEPEAAEMIECHIEHTTPLGMPIHLSAPFVRHFMCRSDGELPTIHTVATSPIVLANGDVLAIDGLDRERCIDFHIEPEVLAIVPRMKDCTDDAVGRAIKFLFDDWLVDVETDFTGKCVLISLTLTIIERSLLPERPAYFVVAGKRGSGKTTAIAMLIRAVTGEWPAAAAWSPSDEERRKALLSYLMKGSAYILWDNIPRGAQLSCPNIERAITSPIYSDRILGVTESASPASTTVHCFTGNNIGAKGDLASRSLFVRLDAKSHDPENRKFQHIDPIGWTDQHRGKILNALYTILLWNPQLKKPQNAPSETRFKLWWRMVGSAIENAAKLVDDKSAPKFKDLFLANEEEDTESNVPR